MLKSSSLCLYSSNLGTLWLKIEQFWPFEEISIFSNSSHPEWRAGLSDTILKGTHPGTIPARFGLIWFSGFRGKDLNEYKFLQLSIAALLSIKMSSNFSCSYMTMSRLTYILGFYVNFFFNRFILIIEEIYILSNSSHLEWRVELSDTILKWDYPRTIPARFSLICIYIPGFYVKFLFQPIYTDYAN
jgi:hypothetical protein